MLSFIDNSKEPSLKAIAIAGSIGNFKNNTVLVVILNYFILGGIVGSIPNNPLEVVKLQLQTHGKKS